MTDWRGSSLQIVVAIIGSSLVVTALTSLSSIINKPILTILVEVRDYPSFGTEDNSTTYRISLVNNGNSPAKDIRLTMTYPDVEVFDITSIYQNENITLTNETSNTIVALLPRLSTGAEIVVENKVDGVLAGDFYFYDARNDFSDNYEKWVYIHNAPFSIIATYDQGSVTYHSPVLDPFQGITSVYFNIEVLKFYMPIVLALLLFAIAFRYKGKSKSRSASQMLADIITVERNLKDEDSRAILSFSKDGSYESNVTIFENYDDYNLVDDFYAGLKERESIISTAYLSTDMNLINSVLKEQNNNCFNLASSAHSNIDWKNFYKFDLILLIPAIVLGSSFISLVCEAIPLILLLSNETIIGNPQWFFPLFFISTFTARSVATYFILRWILLNVQGSSLTTYTIPVLSRTSRFFAYCSVIMGIPSTFIMAFVMLFLSIIGYIPVGSEFLPGGLLIFFLVLDFARMFLLTKVVSRFPDRLKMKGNFLKIIKKR